MQLHQFHGFFFFYIENFFEKIGAVYVDKGASVSLMLLPTVDGAPVPQRVKAGKRDREEVAPLPRHAPAVVGEDVVIVEPGFPVHHGFVDLA